MMTAILLANIAVLLIFSFVAAQPTRGESKPSLVDFLMFIFLMLMSLGNAYIAMVLNQ